MLGLFVNIIRRGVVVFTLSIASVAAAADAPFDHTCEIVAAATDDIGIGCANNTAPLLSFMYSFGSNSKQAQYVLESMTKKYGQPDSVRGHNHIWRIDNPEKTSRQKKDTTIILTLDPTGESTILMDRVRPGSVKATGKKKPAKANKERSYQKKQRSNSRHLEKRIDG